MTFKIKQFLFYPLFICFLSLNINARQPKSSTKILTVDYCDLARDPVTYNNKVIRIKAVYGVAFESSVMYDNNCKEPKSTWVEFDSDAMQSTDKQILKKFRTLTDGTRKVKGKYFISPIRKVAIIWIGLFQGTYSSGGYGHMNAFDYQFTVQKIEEVRHL